MHLNFPTDNGLQKERMHVRKIIEDKVMREKTKGKGGKEERKK